MGHYKIFQNKIMLKNIMYTYEKCLIMNKIIKRQRNKIGHQLTILVNG